MRVMRTLYVADHAARLRIRRGNVVVERSAESTRFPIETLEAVVLTGRAEVSNDALGELVQRGVRVSALSKSGRLRFWVGGPTTGNVLLRLAQFRIAADVQSSLAVARWLVAGKLQNCRRMMRRWACDAASSLDGRVIEQEITGVEDRLVALVTARDGDTVRGIEGDGSRRYFKAMAVHLRTSDHVLSFPRRSRRPPRDPVNALLSFTYGLVLAEVIGGIEAVGLDPQVGFLHGLRPGRPSLGLDLMEEMRPSIADRFAVAALRRGQISFDDFEARYGQAVFLSDGGRKKVLALYDAYRQHEIVHPLLDRSVPVSLLPAIQATLMARHLRGDLPAYPSFTLAA
jgi:CRISPR-associated protein Cas1